MPTSTLKINRTELTKMIEHAVEQKLLELLGDPDERLTLRESLRARLLRQKQSVAKGQRGEDFTLVAHRLGLHK